MDSTPPSPDQPEDYMPAPASPDILIRRFDKKLPVSRAGTERALQRIDRYDRRAELVAFETLTPTGTVRLTFRMTDEEPFTYGPGQFIGIKPGVSGLGNRRTPYCIASPPTPEPEFQLLVRLVPEGPLSRYLASLKVGDTLNFRGPNGRVLNKRLDEYDTEIDEVIFLATGVGISPIHALLCDVLPSGYAKPMRLFWGLRLTEDICYVEEFDELAHRYPNFSYQISLSQPPEDWTGHRGRLTETVPPQLESLGRKFYVLVGNGAMIEELAQPLSDLGVDRRFIYEEAFFNGRHRADPKVLEEIRARFVADDLVSPFEHQEAGLFMPEVPIAERRRRRVASST